MIVSHMILDKIATEQTTYEGDVASEKPMRSVVKAISWRVVGTLDTLIISYMLIGEIVLATSIATVDFVTKMILYFFHERLWNRIKWGK